MSLRNIYSYLPSFSENTYQTGLAVERVQQLKKIPGFLLILVALHEDDLFFIHNGFNIPEIKRSIIFSFKSRKSKGGSSITQQLVKNVFVLARYGLLKKPLEILYTVITERILSKEEIFILYLDNLRFGYKTEIGWTQAVDKYFSKKSYALTLSEALYLCNLIPNPSIRSYFVLRKGDIDKFPYSHIYGRLFDFIRFVVSKWGPLSLNSLDKISFEDAVKELKLYHLFRHDLFDQNMQKTFGIRVDWEMSKLRNKLEELIVRSSKNLVPDPLNEIIKNLN